MIKLKTKELHFDESSPHLHIVGVPVKENCKTGMNKQVGKSDVFNVGSLKDIQKELRESCIEEFNKVYNLDMELKEKDKYKSTNELDYQELKHDYEDNKYTSICIGKEINYINDSLNYRDIIKLIDGDDND